MTTGSDENAGDGFLLSWCDFMWFFSCARLHIYSLVEICEPGLFRDWRDHADMNAFYVFGISMLIFIHHCRFLVENVASMSWVDREEITRHLKLSPLELDSQEITAAKRRRLYWTNIPHPARLPRLRDHPSTCLQSCLENARPWEQKCGVRCTSPPGLVECLCKSMEWLNFQEHRMA